LRQFVTRCSIDQAELYAAPTWQGWVCSAGSMAALDADPEIARAFLSV